MNPSLKTTLGKVPAVTLGFWVIKIAATTLGETAGDAVTMSMNLGYLTGSLIFAAIFMVAVSAQIAAKRFHPFLFWAVIVATTTADQVAEVHRHGDGVARSFPERICGR